MAVRIPLCSFFFRLGGLGRSQISARIGARQSNRRGNLSRGVFPYWAIVAVFRAPKRIPEVESNIVLKPTPPHVAGFSQDESL